MNINVCLISSLRKPFRSFLLLTLVGLVSFGFISKAVGYVFVQRATEVLGSYYRSIGSLKNDKDPQGDVSAGINLIQSSPYLAYDDQRSIISGVMPQTYNANGNLYLSNATILTKQLPEEYWPNVHMTDIWFAGELVEKEEIKTYAEDPKDQKLIGYYLTFDVDTVFAAYPEEAQQGNSTGLVFIFKGNEKAVPTMKTMTAGQRYFIHGWEDIGALGPDLWESTHGATFQIIPLNDQHLWYIPLAKGESIDFSAPGMASIRMRLIS
jgi:hypothetical protein